MTSADMVHDRTAARDAAADALCAARTRDTESNEAATALRNVLGDPIYNPILRKEVGPGGLDYEAYLRTQELLAPQTPAGKLLVPDEPLFQIAAFARSTGRYRGATFPG